MPAATRVTLAPDTVQTDGVVELKVTANPDVAVADMVNGGAPRALLPKASNVMLCACRDDATVNDRITYGAGLGVALPD